MKKIVVLSLVCIMLFLMTATVLADDNSITLKVEIPAATYTLSIPSKVVTLTPDTDELQEIGTVSVKDVTRTQLITVTPTYEFLTNTENAEDLLELKLFLSQVSHKDPTDVLLDPVELALDGTQMEDGEAVTEGDVPVTKYALYTQQWLDGDEPDDSDAYFDIVLSAQVENGEWQKATAGATYEALIEFLIESGNLPDDE